MVTLAACSGDDGREVRGSGSGTEEPTGSGTCAAEGTIDALEAPTLDVTVRSFAVEADPTTIDGGAVSVEALNDSRTAHEMLIVRAEDVEDLPVTDGALDEGALADDAIAGRIEGVEPQASCPATFELDAGRYLLLCNLVEGEGAARTAHLQEGMVTAITVTD